MDAKETLLRYNPLLVLLPQDTSLHRPGSRWSEEVSEPRGDYHPCAAETFLSLVVQRDRPKRWSPLAFSEPALPAPDGLEVLRAKLLAATPAEVQHWELDVAPLQSQKPQQAWPAYGALLAKRQDDFRPVAYGRYWAGPPAVLQYWYLYVYNDAPNKHEGDWEMVMLELGQDGSPLRAGYAGHGGGFQRPWPSVQRQGDRPLVYVARGSHAAYFEHRPGGHRANSLRTSKGWPEPFDSLWSRGANLAMDVFQFLRLVDHTPALPSDATASSDRGVVVDPELRILPEETAASEWWMRLDCPWGSRHSRLTGFIGPNPPWRQLQKWSDPIAWLNSCVAA